MITRSRRLRDGWFSIFRRWRKSGVSKPGFLAEPDFALAVEKERSRAERRELVFCIALFDFDEISREEATACHESLAACFRSRLRITDEVGLFRDAFAVLFPETAPAQAAGVTNDLVSIAARQGIVVSTEVFAYPEVDVYQRPSNGPGNNGSVDGDVDSPSSFDHDNGSPASGDLPSSNGPVATASKPQKFSETSASAIKIRRLNTMVPTPIWKRAFDIVGAVCGMILLSPLIIGTMVLVRLTSPGPVFFTQWREGKDGQLFKIYKFRTMRIGADDEKSVFQKLNEQDGPAFKIKDDPRLTSIGRYLRKSCVDELPQLINVLKGEMSLVGPRPLPVDESLNCSLWHRRRLDVLPGMTCFWQVDGGRDIPFDEWMRMDLDYVRRRSLFTDIWLIYKTAIVTLLHRGSV